MSKCYHDMTSSNNDAGLWISKWNESRETKFCNCILVNVRCLHSSRIPLDFTIFIEYLINHGRDCAKTTASCIMSHNLQNTHPCIHIEHLYDVRILQFYFSKVKYSDFIYFYSQMQVTFPCMNLKLPMSNKIKEMIQTKRLDLTGWWCVKELPRHCITIRWT